MLWRDDATEDAAQTDLNLSTASLNVYYAPVRPHSSIHSDSFQALRLCGTNPSSTVSLQLETEVLYGLVTK